MNFVSLVWTCDAKVDFIICFFPSFSFAQLHTDICNRSNVALDCSQSCCAADIQPVMTRLKSPTAATVMLVHCFLLSPNTKANFSNRKKCHWNEDKVFRNMLHQHYIIKSFFSCWLNLFRHTWCEWMYRCEFILQPSFACFFCKVNINS